MAAKYRIRRLLDGRYMVDENYRPRWLPADWWPERCESTYAAALAFVDVLIERAKPKPPPNVISVFDSTGNRIR
jgi:hypothetical protein